MKGKPKTLNSKQDYLYIKENYEESYWKPLFQALLDSRYGWFFIKELSSKEEGIEDDTHKIVEETNMGEEETKYMQYELQENKDAKLFRIGFTVEEVEEIIK